MSDRRLRVRQEARQAVEAETMPVVPWLRETLLSLVPGRSGLNRLGGWAGLVLAELGERQAVGPLSHALHVGSCQGRRWLQQVVGEMGYRRLVEFLVGALEGHRPSVRQRGRLQRLPPRGRPLSFPGPG